MQNQPKGAIFKAIAISVVSSVIAMIIYSKFVAPMIAKKSLSTSTDGNI